MYYNLSSLYKMKLSDRSSHLDAKAANVSEELKYYYIKYIICGVYRKRKTCLDKRITL